MFSVVARPVFPSFNFVPIYAQEGSYSPQQLFPFAINSKITELFLATVAANAKGKAQSPLSPLCTQYLNVPMPPPCRPKSKEELDALKYTYVYMCDGGKDIEGVLTPSEAYLAKALVENDYEPDFSKDE